MLLSRVAENLYWAARFLERAEDTARIVREHTNFLVDLPTSVPVTWEPLLAITGGRTEFDERYPAALELHIVRFLVSDLDNPSSILMCIEQLRENLRTTREVLPREVWQAVNDLYLYVASHHLDGVARRSRSRFLERVIGESLRILGFLASCMSHDEAYEFLRMGRLLERADMTTRVLDVRAGTLMTAPSADNHDDLQWMSVLRSLSALQMYHRTVRAPVSGVDVLRFLLLDPAFPRSVARCLAEVGHSIERLPNADDALDECRAARALLAAMPTEGLRGIDLHDVVDRLQYAIGLVHERVAATYFLSAAVATAP